MLIVVVVEQNQSVICGGSSLLKVFLLQSFVELYSYDDEELYCIPLGKHVTTNNIDTVSIRKNCHVHVSHWVADYSRVTRRMIW